MVGCMGAQSAPGAQGAQGAKKGPLGVILIGIGLFLIIAVSGASFVYYSQSPDWVGKTAGLVSGLISIGTFLSGLFYGAYLWVKVKLTNDLVHVLSGVTGSPEVKAALYDSIAAPIVASIRCDQFVSAYSLGWIVAGYHKKALKDKERAKAQLEINQQTTRIIKEAEELYGLGPAKLE